MLGLPSSGPSRRVSNLPSTPSQSQGTTGGADSRERSNEPSGRDFVCGSSRPGEFAVPPLRVLIVEDCRMSAQMMRKTLETDLNHLVVGEAHDPAGALELITKADPDVVLTELRVSGSDMLQLIDQAKKRGKNPAFVVVSSQCDEVTAHRVEKARLHGFIDRRAEMCEAIRHALNEISHGRRYFSPSWVRMRNARVSNPFSFDKLLTKRQYEILGMIAKLVPDEVIMRTLKISQCTLRGHRRAIARKFDVPLPDLPRFAREKGFGA